ncbi:MAG: N-acetyl-gamma-glutamyl-phosphate reductase [Acidimicrobiia bacterium]|nr:N-acetyl-gamma-glutamyl-phosphate reductase [Acidimicrobiia bacterium]
MHKVAVIGASGFTGAELLRICASHPQLEVTVATGDSMAGRPVADLYPSLAPAYGDTQFVPYEPGVATGCDLAFCALPHGASQSVVGELRDDVKHVVDLAADFRLDDPGLYPAWYGTEHTAPELLTEFVFGLPELFRGAIRGAELVAAPGCYVTTAALALAPLVAAGAVEPAGIIVDAASGVSGAGRPAKPNTTFCTVDEDFTAYGLLTHRHTPEIEMAVSRHAGTDVQVLFTPHLAPMNRGILATCYARPTAGTSTGEVLNLLADAYCDEPFVVVSERSPSTKATLGSNSVHITARADDRTGWVMAIAALDNLVKGASGQAVQCANLALGIDETAGLASAGIYP